MNWKEILKVSSISGAACLVLATTIDKFIMGISSEYSPLFMGGFLTVGIIASGLILNRRLKKEDWSLLIGMLLTVVIFLILFSVWDITGLY